MKLVNLDWTETMPIRHQVLWPHKPLEYCKVDGDENALHFGIKEQGELVCIASLFVDHQSHSARLRKFATLPEHQNRGLGSHMIGHVLAVAKENGVQYFWFDARQSAMGFYERFGFAPQGERFFKGDIPYYKMAMYL